MNILGLSGAIFQMLSHGIISSGLFLVIGVLYTRLHTKEISLYGGVASKMPQFAFLFMVRDRGARFGKTCRATCWEFPLLTLRGFWENCLRRGCGGGSSSQRGLCEPQFVDLYCSGPWRPPSPISL